MAITVSTLNGGNSTSNNTTFTTATISPTNSTDPILLMTCESGGPRTIGAVTVGGSGSGGAAGLGLTWSNVVIGTTFVVSGTQYRTQIWKGIGTNTGAATMDVTYSGATTGWCCFTFQMVGAHLTVPIVSGQTATASSGTDTPGTTATVDLPTTPGSTSAVVGVIATTTAAITGGTNMGNTSTATHGTPSLTILVGYNATSPSSATVSGTFTSDSWGISAAEVAIAASGADTEFIGMIPI